MTEQALPVLRNYTISVAKNFGVTAVHYLRGQTFTEAVSETLKNRGIDCKDSVSLHMYRSEPERKQLLIGTVLRGVLQYQNPNDPILEGLRMLRSQTDVVITRPAKGIVVVPKKEVLEDLSYKIQLKIVE